MSELNPALGVPVVKQTFEDRFPNFSAVPDHLIDAAYDAGPRQGIDQFYRNRISGSGARIQELAADPNVSWDSSKQAMVWQDGSRVLKQGAFSLLNRISEMGMSDLDIIKARRAMQRKELLGSKQEHERIVGVSDEGVLSLKTVKNKNNLQRLKEVRGIHPEARKGGNLGLDVRTDYYSLGDELTAEEKLKDLTTQLKKRNVDISGVEGDAVQLEDLFEEAGVRKGEQKAQKKAQRDATAELAARGIISTQAAAGLNPESGAARVQQRAGGFQMPANLQHDSSLPATEQLRRLKQRDAIDAAILAQDVEYGSKANQDARAWRTYNAELNAYNRKEDRLNALQDAELQFQFQRDQLKMQHENEQFKIREMNKMQRERWEKELEIEEQRRSEADFDNLTRMIMGMAGNL